MIRDEWFALRELPPRMQILALLSPHNTPYLEFFVLEQKRLEERMLLKKKYFITESVNYYSTV